MHVVRDGFLYAGAMTDVASTRHSALLYVALAPGTFQLDTPAGRLHAAAALVRPGTPKRIQAGDVPVACADVYPPHPAFRTLARLGEAVRAWPRDTFAPCADALAAFRAHRLAAPLVETLHHRLVDLAQAQLPSPPPLDPRVSTVLARLQVDVRETPEQLAAAVGLSRDWLVQLFQREVGISLRHYEQTMKLQAAATYLRRGVPLSQVATLAGFSGAAHFSRRWKQRFGFAPHRVFSGDELRVDPLACAPARRDTEVASRPA